MSFPTNYEEAINLAERYYYEGIRVKKECEILENKIYELKNRIIYIENNYKKEVQSSIKNKLLDFEFEKRQEIYNHEIIINNLISAIVMLLEKKSGGEKHKRNLIKDLPINEECKKLVTERRASNILLNNLN